MVEPMPKFEHSVLEEDIKRLSVEMKERGLAEKGKEGLKTVVKEQIPSPVPGAPIPTQPSAPPVSSVTLPSYMDRENNLMKLKVEKLLDLAWHKGLKRAAEEARDSGPLVMDAFHDAITDKLYGEFQKRGLL
jgi:hypothetical protein